MAGGIRHDCPACGFGSDEIRCPRCNALKVVGCTGSCTTCRDSSCKTSVPPAPRRRPSDDAVEDPDLIGTPLEP